MRLRGDAEATKQACCNSFLVLYKQVPLLRSSTSRCGESCVYKSDIIATTTTRIFSQILAESLIDDDKIEILPCPLDRSINVHRRLSSNTYRSTPQEDLWLP
ncbi:hypothetical protein FIBSPDRAFT_966444 [Athelia psychrophila]|uniref:Uncharacterized protein n=1 Tax=Athelia psychrophila TaxID=1759441 RepID=A0A167WT43_9AGAM|nr:hypothetical protein FIBSPDRAFT_966444 [Fibularhizoctonia sp. CBS 109695]